jgi:hypothetical protein
MARLTPNQADRQNEAKAAEAELARQREAANKFRSTQTTTLSERSNQPRKPDNWHETIMNYRNSKNSSGSGPAPATAPVALAPVAPVVTVAAPAAVPPPPPEPPDPPIFKAVKAAPIDTVLFVDEKFSQEFITDLLFEDVAGQELLSIARDDTVNGQEVIYQPIKNLGILRDIYDINNLLKLQETSDRFFANFLINLFQKIPIVGNGPNGKNYYFDEDLGDIIIDFVNMRDDEQVEIQISNAGIIEQVGI